MKSKKILLIPAMVAMLLSGCGKGDPGAGKNKIQFWGWGDEVEMQVFKDLVKQYNANNTDYIYVEYTVKPTASYVSSMDKILGQNKTPDIFYVGDGDVNKFITMMNDKTKELGCTNTHFTNPNGLPDPNHYTSARDMALISKAAYENKIFDTIFSAKSVYEIFHFRFCINMIWKQLSGNSMIRHTGICMRYARF